MEKENWPLSLLMLQLTLPQEQIQVVNTQKGMNSIWLNFGQLELHQDGVPLEGHKGHPQSV